MENKLNTTKPFMPPLDEYVEMIKNIWQSAWLTNMGDLHNELENKLKVYLGVDNLSLFVNGHMALEMVLQALCLKGEVITTPFTFVSTTHAIVRNRLQPVFCDINARDYTLDAEKIEDLITDKTCAIVPVHVYGNVCNLEAIDRIAKKHNLKVVYDAAHAFGVKYKGKSVAEFGDASMFSFHATKVFNTIEGGAVVYHDENVGRSLYNLKNFGIRSEEIVESVGANAKMNEFQAAMGLCNLLHIEEAIYKRKQIVEYYQQCLKDCQGIILNQLQDNVTSNYAYMPVLFEKGVYPKERNEVYEHMKEHDIFARKYFYPLVNEAECYRGVFEKGDTPIAKRISESVLTLPLYPDMTKSDVDRVCEVIWKLCR